jgi:hypothetical protein
MTSTYNTSGLSNSRKRVNTLFTRLFRSKSISSANARIQRKNNAPEVKLIVHNQCLGIELVSPVYAYDNATCHLSPDQRLDSGSTMKAGFNIDSTQEESIGILMYELKNTKQFSNNVISREDKARCAHFSMIWKVNNSKEFYVNWHIIVHEKGRIWNRDKLIELAKQCDIFNIKHSPIEETLLTHNNTVLMTRANITHEGECYILEITISETNIRHNTWRPWYLDMDR